MRHDKSSTKGTPPLSAPEVIYPDELREFNLRRALMYLADPKAHARAAGVELGVASRARAHGLLNTEASAAIYVPFQVLARDLVVGTATAGGHLVAADNQRSRAIDLLRPASKVIQLGAQVLEGLVGSVPIPRMTGGSTIEWVAEGSAPSEGAPAWDQVAMAPKTAAGFVDIGRRLQLQTGGDAARFVAGDLLAGIATAIDVAAIKGTGASNQPRGILNTSGIGSVAGGTNGAAPTFDHAVDLEAAVANANASLETPGYLTNSRVRAKLEKTQMFGGSNGVPVWQSRDVGDVLKGRSAGVSNNVPGDLTKGTSSGVCSAIIYGNWSDLIVGIWGSGVVILADPYTLGTTGTLRLVVMVDCDVALRYVTSFASMQDALTA